MIRESSICSIQVNPVDANMLLLSAERHELLVLYNIKKEKVHSFELSNNLSDLWSSQYI